MSEPTRGDLGGELRRLLETMPPDLRRHFRPVVTGVVARVYDDDSDPDTYYRVDVHVTQDDGQVLALTEVPVAALWAQDGYGVWALPEVGSVLNVAFYDGEVTNPYIDAATWREGLNAPTGFTAGTFAIRGKQNQKLEFKPASNEVVVHAASFKLITSQHLQEAIAGLASRTVDGDQAVTVNGLDSRTAERSAETTTRAATRSYGALSETVQGRSMRAVGGSDQQSIGGDRAVQVAGDDAVAVLGTQRVLAANSLEYLAGVKMTFGSPLMPSLVLEVLPGAGGLMLGTSQAALAEPAVLGTTLVTILQTLLTHLQTSLQIGNLGAPTAPNPVFAGNVAALQGQLASALSLTVKVAK